MGDADGLLSYRELIGEVRHLCAQRQTGSVFITTSNNHAVRFALQNGTIIAVSFRQQTGLDALVSIQRITKGRLKYSDELLHHAPQAGLPSTPELLSMLHGAAAEPPEGRPANAGPVNESLARSRAVIESELAEYLGPMARVVCGEYIATASNLTDLIESLAKELRDTGKASRFMERVRDRLASTPAKS